MINEDGVSTASVGPVGLGSVPNSGNNSKTKKRKQRIIRNPAVSKAAVNKDYFPEPKNPRAKKSILGSGGIIGESLQRVKFVYTGKKATVGEPEVMILDPNYDGQEHWKSYGKKDYILGYSLSHVINKSDAIRNINDITDFTTLLGSDDDREHYDRLKQLFPEQAAFIRAYKKGNIVAPRILDDNNNEVPINLINLKSARENGYGF